MQAFVESATLLLVILNPFALSVYLAELVRTLSISEFRSVVSRAALISCVVFIGFALTGNLIFERVLQVRFAAFQIFGGIIFLIIAVRFVLSGGETIASLRGAPAQRVAGAVAMPFMIGPGTVGASVLAGSRNGPLKGSLAIVTALLVTVVLLLLLKNLHDHVQQRRAELIDRYVDIVGRVTALAIGTIAVEMLLQGLVAWHAQR